MKTKIQNLFIALIIFAGIHQAAAQGTTAFTYQGQLKDNGTNANGTYTMIFKLYDALTSGNQVGSALTNSATLANGLFTVNLDFGGSAFTGPARWLDITVTNGGATQELSPRVQVLPAPYAQFAAVAAMVTNGAITSAQLAGSAVASANIQNGAVTNRNLTANAVNGTNIASGQVVKTLDGLTDAVVLAAGANVTLATNGNTLTVASSGGGGNAALATNVVSGISITNAFITNSVFAGNGGGLTNLHLAASSVATTNIQNNAVTNRNLTANAVNGTNIASGQVVKTLNSLTDAVVLAAGANITLTTNANTLQIAATGGSGGTVTNINIGITNRIAPGANVGLFTNNNIVQISSFVPNIQLFTSSGTFTVPTNVTRIMVEMWGAGGGGGNGYYETNVNNNGNADGGESDAYSGGGGGAGAYAWNVFTVTNGTSISVTPGTAGNAGQAGTGSSFGSFISATGGSAGGNASGGGSGSGGSGGQTTTGSLHNVEGGDGQWGDSNGFGGGNGGGVWRGGAQNSEGPGAGGQGGGPGSFNNPSSGESGSTGVVIVYY